jgi:hypothetical protein
MKMNRFSLSDSDTAELCFNGQFKEKDYQITILVLERLFHKDNLMKLIE